MTAETLAEVDLVITSYGALLRYEWLSSTQWRVLVIDEAQAIKNPGAKQTRAVKKLSPILGSRSPAHLSRTVLAIFGRFSTSLIPVCWALVGRSGATSGASLKRKPIGRCASSCDLISCGA